MQFHELKQKVAQRTATLRAGCLCVERHATRRAEPRRGGIAVRGDDCYPPKEFNLGREAGVATPLIPQPR
jgi:hypothetical protein